MASRLVMKFGGTSVADLERIRRVARLVAAEVRAGHGVAVVVSAMAGDDARASMASAAPINPCSVHVLTASSTSVYFYRAEFARRYRIVTATSPASLSGETCGSFRSGVSVD